MLCTLGAAVTSRSFAADEPTEVARLLQSGQGQQALERADRFLALNPRDPQMRFLKATLLGQAERNAEAVAILEKLTEDYPDLPEPYNNLAVLHAAAGNYAKARGELEQALRLKPSYATAQENLGDVQAALAREAYGAALRLEPGRTDVSAKLALVRQLLPAATARAASAAPTASGAR
jgi:tetratricopeptide (TPR) repeat protein